MSEQWHIGDTHFGHSNIIKLAERPFASVEEMDEALIENWNKTVGKQDIVYHHGDLSFYGKEKTSKILSRLRGRICLILGNHDQKIQWYKGMKLHRIYDKPIVIDDFFILSHYRLYSNNFLPYANLYAHEHESGTHGARRFCTSVELIDYKPIHFDVIMETMKECEEALCLK